MPPRTRYTKDRIIAEAFKLVEEKGIRNLSARNVAKRLNMSLAPIYSSFDSMDQLKKEIIKKSKALLLSYTSEQYTERIFLNIGTGIVLFARDHPNIYKAIFIEGNHYRDIVNEFMVDISTQMRKDPRFTGMAEEDRDELLNKMWIFAHGLASLTFAGLVDKTSQEEIIATLNDVGTVVIKAALHSAKHI